MSSTALCIIQIIAVSTLVLLVWSFFLFPKVMGALAKILKRKIEKDSSYEPSITLFIPAYNEEIVIGKKIENALSIDYPQEKLEIMICSDCSSDATNEIVQSYAIKEKRITFFDFEERSGKTGMINKALPKAKGEIVILTDANTMFEKDAFSVITQSFYSKKVGAVLGQVQLYVPDEKEGLEKEVSYRAFETDVKYVEGLWGASMGAFGGFYAIRKSLFTPLPFNAYSNDDFLIPTKILSNGYRVHLEKQALSKEETGVTINEEFSRRIRIGAGNFQSFCLMPSLLNPLHPIRFIYYISHKVTRWFSPFLLLLLFASSGISASSSTLLLILFYAQTAFYAVAAVGWLLNRIGKPVKIMQSVFHFTAMNIALLLGFFRFSRGIKSATWSSIERSVSQ